MTTSRDKDVKASVLNRGEIDSVRSDEMYTLFTRYFVDHDRKVFDSDLALKDHVILLESGSKLVGFSTMQFTREHYKGREIAVLFSGDTIIDSEFWGSGQLETAFLDTALKMRDSLGMPVYWFLICSGYRTYRYLSVFMKEFWPRWDRATPPEAQELLAYLALQRFGDAYDNGIVKLPGGRLRDGVSPINESRMKNPHVAFFAQRNPGHLDGHELACLTRLEPGNLSRAGLRVLGRLQIA